METSNIKIAYDPNFLSKEEIDKINGDNNGIELIEHSLNSNAPKNGLILSTILLILSSIPGNVASSFIYDLIKLAFNRFTKKHVFWVNSSNEKTPSVASILINGGKDKNINLILKKEPTEIEWLNINDVLKHLKDDNYIVVLNEDGRINIWTNLEYDQCQFNKQEKK